MKKLFACTIAMVLAGFISSGCGDDDSTSPTGGTPQTASGTASFTLNGAGFSNQSITVSNSMGGFDADENATAFAGVGTLNSSSVQLSVAFPGNSTGTFQFGNDDAGVAIGIGTGASLRQFFSGSGTGQIVITAYGNVGGNITGTFSGKLYEVITGGALDSVTVTNGAFNAQRMN